MSEKLVRVVRASGYKVLIYKLGNRVQHCTGYRVDYDGSYWYYDTYEEAVEAAYQILKGY